MAHWDTLRARFFLTYTALWALLGTWLAVAFSSAGPVYFDEVTGSPGGFEPLLAYLEDLHTRAPLMALEVQRLLWDGHVGLAESPVEGISAMPSMHVAIPILLAITAYRVHRALGLAMSAYVLLVFAGSVHLAWHYAVDGYAASLLVPLVWVGAGRVQEWTDARSSRGAPH
ncbi:MAG TPA: phosphatase PAP2 family protein [Longimicrobiales bacterium]|nr:phosphatase PAP2 family protein [Longimicrobiales bacterium]